MQIRAGTILVAATSILSSIAVLLSYATSGNANAQAAGYALTFPWMPAGPMPYNPPDIDLTVHSRDPWTWGALEPMQAQHDDSCNPPPSTHATSSYEGALFVCHEHLMSAINAGGYGLIYFTPNAMLDFSNGEATLDFDMSTQRASARDWVDLWITPFADNVQLALEPIYPDLNGTPQNAVHVKMDNNGGGSTFNVSVISNFYSQDVDGQWWVPYESFLTPSASQRDRFELRLSRTHVKFGMPHYDFWWVDADIADLGWTQGVAQLGHHSYTPDKGDCVQGNCGPNTWHWDNITINPASPFTIVRADQRWVDGTTAPDVTFGRPAPSNAYLRFVSFGDNVQVSFDGGHSWQAASQQIQSDPDSTKFQSYWTPIPAGASAVQIRAQDRPEAPWLARDFSIWAPSGSNAAPFSQSGSRQATPSQSSVDSQATMPVSNQGPLAQLPIVAVRAPLTGQGLGAGPTANLSAAIGWFLNNPLGHFTVGRLSSNGQGIAQGTFTFNNPVRVVSLTAHNSDTLPSKVTLQCKGQRQVHAWVPSGGSITVTTGWTGKCASFTASSSTSWATVLGGLVVSPV